MPVIPGGAWSPRPDILGKVRSLAAEQLGPADPASGHPVAEAETLSCVVPSEFRSQITPARPLFSSEPAITAFEGALAVTDLKLTGPPVWPRSGSRSPAWIGVVHRNDDRRWS